MKKKKTEEIVKNLIDSVATDIREERQRRLKVLRLNIERTKHFFLESLSSEQLELYQEYEMAQAEYCDYIVENKE